MGMCSKDTAVGDGSFGGLHEVILHQGPPTNSLMQGPNHHHVAAVASPLSI